MKQPRRSREELLRLVDDEERIKAAYGRMMGAFERDETPQAADFDVLFSLMTPEQKEDNRRASVACIQLLAAEGNAEAIELAHKHGIQFQPFQIH